MSKDMQLIMENWREYTSTPEELTLIENLQQSIFEDLDKINKFVLQIKGQQTLLSEEKILEGLKKMLQGLWNKTKSLVAAAKNAIGGVLMKIMTSLVNIFETLLSKLPGAKARYISGTLKKYTNQLGDVFEDDFGEGSQWPKKIKALVQAEMEALQNEGVIPGSDIPYQELKQEMGKNRQIIANRIKNTILNSPDLDSIKSLVQSRGGAVVDAIENDVSKSFGASVKGFAAGSSFMLGFGMVDNYGLWLGVASIEDWIAVNYPAMTVDQIGQIGNTFSDILGVLVGVVLAKMILKMTGAKGEGTTAQNVVGVAVGCLIPFFNSLLIGLG